MPENTLKSPDSLEIRGAPLASARLSKKAALIGIAALAVVLGFIIVNVSKDPKQAKGEQGGGVGTKTLEPALNAAQTLTMDVPDVLPTPKPVEVPALPALPAPPDLPEPGRPAVTETGSAPARSSEDEALLSDTMVSAFSSAQFARSSSRATVSDGDLAGGEHLESGRSGGAGGLPGADGGALGNAADLNQQPQKLAFLQQSRRSTYLDSRVTAPVSPFELKTGTVIPGVLLSELNSDLPGEIVAQVAQNVYDTASGNHLLIPQGTKLFGRYDSQVTFGQGRLLVSWQRLIFPDASTLELDAMGGYDREGNSGFAGRVNNHYGRIFGWALLTSAISAGYQISQPQQNNNNAQLSNQQIAAGAVGQQMAELGEEMARRNMQVQPTIKIPKGYRLHVMVNKDVVFPGSYEL